MNDADLRDPRKLDLAEERCEEADRPPPPEPVGRLVRWHGGLAAAPAGRRRLVYTEDTTVVALLDSVGAYIYEAFPLAARSESHAEPPTGPGRKVLAVAAELRDLADFLRRSQRIPDPGQVWTQATLVKVGARAARALDAAAAELARAAAEALAGDPRPQTEPREGSNR